MYNAINKYNLAVDKFIPDMHLIQPEITYNLRRSFTKNKKRIQTFQKMGDSRNIYQNELDKTVLYGLW